MQTVYIHVAKTQLSRLLEKAVKGESFIIAKAGKPLVKVTPLDAPKSIRPIAFMAGEITVPQGFDTMGDKEVKFVGLVVGRDGEQTCNIKGIATVPTGLDLTRYQGNHFSAWPEGRMHLKWPGIAYFVARPR